MREKGKDIFFIFEFLWWERRTRKMMQCMKILDLNMWCMQEHHECQDEHQEHFECQDEHQELIFGKFLYAKKACKTPNLEFFNA